MHSAIYTKFIKGYDYRIFALGQNMVKKEVKKKGTKRRGEWGEREDEDEDEEKEDMDKNIEGGGEGWRG